MTDSEAGEIPPNTDNNNIDTDRHIKRRRESVDSHHSHNSQDNSATSSHSHDIDVDFYTPIANERRAKRSRSSTLVRREHSANSNSSTTNNTTTSTPSRTVYLGQLPVGVTFREVFDVIKTGPVESLRFLSDKDCAFVDFCREADADRFRQRFRGHRLSLRGQDVKVSWAKPSHLSESVVLAMQWGATRNVYFSGVTIAKNDDNGEYSEEEQRLWEHRLLSDCQRFGGVDMVKLVPEKAIAFVHMARVCDAMEAVSWLSADPAWRHARVNFGTDRCGGPAERPSLQSPPCQRTIYFGGIPKADCKPDRVCAVVHGGVLDCVRVIADKQSAFVTFVRPEDAERYYNLAVAEGVTIGGVKVKVSWASERALSMQTIHALQRGATRCICIDNLDTQHTSLAVLTKDIESKYKCEVESAWKSRREEHRQDSASVFVSFTSIREACVVLDGLRFDRAFHGCKVSFARDRCSIPAVPKPQPQHQIHVTNGGSIPYISPYQYAYPPMYPPHSTPPMYPPHYPPLAAPYPPSYPPPYPYNMMMYPPPPPPPQ